MAVTFSAKAMRPVVVNSRKRDISSSNAKTRNLDYMYIVRTTFSKLNVFLTNQIFLLFVEKKYELNVLENRFQIKAMYRQLQQVKLDLNIAKWLELPIVPAVVLLSHLAMTRLLVLGKNITTLSSFWLKCL